ncbi:MAG: Do family serine endopeptidase [Candidatus Krumholzibacteriota bacterium]|nr:Do family serine endopeptidase [Candidatus Krumholzibacteriota bacterium]
MKENRSSKKWFLIISAALVISLGIVLQSGIISGFRVSDCDTEGLSANAYAAAAEDESLPDIIERVAPAVVNISSKRVVKTKPSPYMSDPFFRQFFERFFRGGNIPSERVQRSLGSGVIVDNGGYILTSNHLVNEADEIEVILTDKREFDAEIIGTDPKSDIAVIKIEGDDLPAVKIGKSDDLRLGQTVIAIGYPFGVGQTVTKGIISALGRSLKLVDYEDFIQTDAAINPGNSGGALINTRGELVGINTAIVTRSGGSQGIGFAIPLDLATSIMKSIIENGYVVRGYIGVYPQDVTPEMARVFGLEDAGGALIAQVEKDTPADRAGLERGDIIISFGGKKVKDSKDLHSMAAAAVPGTELKIGILRDKKRKKIDIEIGERPDGDTRGKRDEKGKSHLFIGARVKTLDDYYRRSLDIPDDIKGVVIIDIEPESPAVEAGLKKGDVIVEINRKEIENRSDFRDLLEEMEKNTVILAIYRNGHYFYVEIES